MSDMYVRQRKDILWLIFSRSPRNALTTPMLEHLAHTLQQALYPARNTFPQRLPRLLVLTSSGEEAFCSGVDLPDDTEAQRTTLLLAARKVDEAFMALREHHVPTVALVKGSVFGAGCELASLCDTIIAREDARFRLPASNARVFPSSTTRTLPELIGRDVAQRMMQTGETLNAREAMHLGLAHQVLPTYRFLLDAEQLLTMLAS